MDRTVVFILSTNYAGSHFASLMLGSHSGAMHVGEVCHLRKETVHKPMCIRCGSFDRCPLFKDIRPEVIDQTYDLIFSAMPAGKDVIVDNSKKAFWAEQFLGRPGYRKKILHLIRDPRALVRRWDMYYQKPPQVREQRWRLMRRNLGSFLRLWAAPPRLLYVYKWLDQNRRITQLIRSRGLDSLLVTYMDLAKDTEGELRRIMDWIGLPFEPGQIEYWNFDHHGSQKREYEWVKQEKRRFFDARWKEYLTPEEQTSFAQNPHVQEYLTDLGLRITSDGLTRHP
jgi:hypothetical protein